MSFSFLESNLFGLESILVIAIAITLWESFALRTFCPNFCKTSGHFAQIHFAPTFFAYYFGISLAYLGHILGMSWPYHIDMPKIWPRYAQWPSLGNILDISWEWFGHILGMSSRHILGMSWADLRFVGTSGTGGPVQFFLTV